MPADTVDAGDHRTVLPAIHPDLPQAAAALVLHDVHGVAKIENPRPPAVDDRAADVVEPEHILGSQWRQVSGDKRPRHAAQQH